MVSVVPAMLGLADRVQTVRWLALGGVLALAMIAPQPHGRVVTLIGYVERDSLSPERDRFVMFDELGSRPPITVIVPGDLDKRVCGHVHRDVYVEGWLVGDRLLATTVVAFDDHRYDSRWASRCDEPALDEVYR